MTAELRDLLETCLGVAAGGGGGQWYRVHESIRKDVKIGAFAFSLRILHVIARFCFPRAGLLLRLFTARQLDTQRARIA